MEWTDNITMATQNTHQNYHLGMFTLHCTHTCFIVSERALSLLPDQTIPAYTRVNKWKMQTFFIYFLLIQQQLTRLLIGFRGWQPTFKFLTACTDQRKFPTKDAAVLWSWQLLVPHFSSCPLQPRPCIADSFLPFSYCLAYKCCVQTYQFKTKMNTGHS